MVHPTALRLLTALALAVLATLHAVAADLAAVAGRVDFIEGDVRFLDAAMKARRPLRGDVLRANETIVTGADGEVHLDMDDGGYLAVRPLARLRIEDFRARGDADDRMVIRLVQGAMRSITGWIARVNRPRYKIQTFTATLGVRGTDHETLVVPEGAAGGEPGTYEKVNEGATFLENPTGRVDVDRERAGFAPMRGKIRLLRQIPDLFRATRNEGLMSDRHRAVQDSLEQRLEQRRLEIRQQPGPDSEVKPPAQPDAATPPTSATPATAAPAVAAPAGAGAAAAGVAGAAVAAPEAAAAVAAPAAEAAGAAASSSVQSIPTAVQSRLPGAGLPKGSESKTTVKPTNAAPAASEPQTAAQPALAEPAAKPGKVVADPAPSATTPAARAAQPSGQGATTPRTVATPARAETREEAFQRRRQREREDREGLYERDRELERIRERELDRDHDRALLRRKREQY